MIRLTTVLIAFSLAFGFSPSASASVITYNFPNETDALSIVLDPPSGAVDGLAGSDAGWGFTVTWTATNNFISFSGSSLSGETNDSFLNSYTDFIGANSGPDGIALGPDPANPGPVTWTQTFDPVAMTGVGDYSISSDPTLALPYSTDSGTIVFNFEVYYGYPTDPLAEDLGSYNYSGDSTAFTVTVDPPPPPATDNSNVPEPATLGLMAVALPLAWLARRLQLRYRIR